MYAIVDIETTGGYAAANDITEIAVLIHDGEKVVKEFHTLIKPARAIPHYIQVLTGITPDMVANAPTFQEIAPELYELLQPYVFVAHNVNFDYSFLKHHLDAAGYSLKSSKLCTVRLTRKVFPGLPSYSLGNLCRHFQIPIKARHRAFGDAAATAVLWDLILKNEGQTFITQALQKGKKEMSLPTHVAPDALNALPYTPGVYYFHDQKGKVVYVGKAKNIKYRVRSHFSHNGSGKQRQEFIRHIHKITYKECDTELMAFVLESIEIKRLWPPFNKSQKTFAPKYGLIQYRDQNGYDRLAIDKKKKNMAVLYSFQMITEGHRLLKQLVEDLKLCPKLCYIQKDESTCVGMENNYCKGACEQKESPALYNKKVWKATTFLKTHLPSFAIIEDSFDAEKQSCIIMDQGMFYGMGHIPKKAPRKKMEQLKQWVEPQEDSELIRGMLLNYAAKNPEKIIYF